MIIEDSPQVVIVESDPDTAQIIKLLLTYNNVAEPDDVSLIVGRDNLDDLITHTGTPEMPDRPNVTIVDYGLIMNDPLSYLAKLRQHYGDSTRFVVWTGYDARQAKVMINDKSVLCIQKPFDPQGLLGIIRNLI